MKKGNEDECKPIGHKNRKKKEKRGKNESENKNSAQGIQNKKGKRNVDEGEGLTERKSHCKRQGESGREEMDLCDGRSEKRR